MRPLLIPAHLLCLAFSSVAVHNHGTGVALRVDHDVAGHSSGPTEAGISASVQSPFLSVEDTQNDPHLPLALRSTGVAPPEQQSPFDFWEMAKASEDVLQDYVPRLLSSAAAHFKSTNFTDITSIVDSIVRSTAAFRDNITSALDAHNITLDALTGELEARFAVTVDDLQKMPPPSNPPGHTGKEEIVDKFMEDVEFALVGFASRYGMNDDAVTTYLDALGPRVQALTTTIGSINEQLPQLFPILSFSVSAKFAPESWILRPATNWFGFGPAGPNDSPPNWPMLDATVQADSLSSLLQAAESGAIPQWAELVAVNASPAVGRR